MLSLSEISLASADAEHPAPAEEVLAALAAGDASAVDGVLFDGFEPFAHPALVEILDHARRAGYRRIGLQTDGGALSDSRNAHGCIGTGVRFFEIDLFGADAGAHDAATGKPGLFDAAAQGAANIGAVARAEDLPVFLTVVAHLGARTASMLPALVAVAARWQADAVRVAFDEEMSLSPTLPTAVAQALELAVPAGIVLFGDGCTQVQGATLYSRVHVDAPSSEAVNHD